MIYVLLWYTLVFLTLAQTHTLKPLVLPLGILMCLCHEMHWTDKKSYFYFK